MPLPWGAPVLAAEIAETAIAKDTRNLSDAVEPEFL